MAASSGCFSLQSFAAGHVLRDLSDQTFCIIEVIFITYGIMLCVRSTSAPNGVTLK
jgi:hypothetical protein